MLRRIIAALLAYRCNTMQPILIPYLLLIESVKYYKPGEVFKSTLRLPDACFFFLYFRRTASNHSYEQNQQQIISGVR